MSTTRPIDMRLRTSAALRVRVQQLETEVLHARAEAEAARDDAARATKSAETAWSFVKQLRGAPMRG